ncbi:uncharacterized protein LOC128190325 [Crassostrea angulata]|uniref:uncharacterized protein LOC128190325 n=1 Tax=Magallana angulata TaxID=2784310 RepID=UPI0022B085B7|nr:uncharacterized protein LOC128190325 [Crassostrea angulata]
MRLPQLIALVSISFEYIQSCCFPSVFEVTKINTIIAEENSTNQEKIYFSAEIGKAAEVRTNEWGQTERKIYDKATKKRYVITDENVCDVTDLYKSIQKMCMPPSAVFIGSTVLDNNNLTVNNYYVNISHENSFIDINLMTIPIKEGVCFVVKRVIKFQNVTLTSEYINHTFEITDMSVFQTPKQCNGANNGSILLTTSLLIILLIHI